MKVVEGLIKDTVGFTCSCFDLLHAGHILMLEVSNEGLARVNFKVDEYDSTYYIVAQRGNE